MAIDTRVSFWWWNKKEKRWYYKGMTKAYNWYSTLIKPSWAPPSWLFAPVWTFLYILIAVSFGKVFLMAFQKQIPIIIILPFILNLFFNFIFTYIQFGLKNNLLAAADILLVLGTLIWAMIAIFFASQKLGSAGGPSIMWIAYIQIPYLLWVAFATVLQLTVTFLNR
jgi:tryptophan-rich sensory protein